MLERISLRAVTFMFLLSFITVSCIKDEKVTPEPAMNTNSYAGSFTSSVHPTSGNAAVSSDKTKLEFSNFKTDSGPDLNIYLVSDLSDIKSDYVDLGDIKGVDGNYIYDISNTTDFGKYKYVVVWCVKFDVNFGYATLEKK